MLDNYPKRIYYKNIRYHFWLPKYEKEAFMSKLKGYRVMLGKTQRQMAETLDISLQSYNNKETGKTAFSDKERLKIKSMVAKIKPDITIDELFY